MTTFQKFKRALIEMKEQGQLVKILNYASKKDLGDVKHDIELIDQLVEIGADNISAIPIIHELKSADIFKNALCYMMRYDEEA